MIYEIRKGDTLTKIAREHGTTVLALMRANPKITDPNKIRAGDTLRIPGRLWGWLRRLFG